MSGLEISFAAAIGWIAGAAILAFIFWHRRRASRQERLVLSLFVGDEELGLADVCARADALPLFPYYDAYSTHLALIRLEQAGRLVSRVKRGGGYSLQRVWSRVQTSGRNWTGPQPWRGRSRILDEARP
jgi:hypothetical protein